MFSDHVEQNARNVFMKLLLRHDSLLLNACERQALKIYWTRIAAILHIFLCFSVRLKAHND